VLRSKGLAAALSVMRSRLSLDLIILFPFGRERRTLRRAYNGSRQYQRTLFRYRPKEFAGKTSLLVNREWNRKHFMMGWGRELGNEVGFYEIPGDHITRLTISGGIVGRIIRGIIDGGT
jgi:hypothetical protein